MKRAIYRLLTIALLGTGLWTTTGGPADAVTQGTTGPTSTGSTDLSAAVPWIARISAVNDISLGTWSGTGALWNWDTLCVWTTTGAYNITASGDGAGGMFAVTNGTDNINYLVAWSDTPSFAGLNLLTPGAALPGQNTNASTTDCNGGASPTATVLVAVFASDLEAAPAGAYSGTLTLVVAPE